MHSPRTLILSITATGCGFLLALVGVIGAASHTAAPVVEVAMAPGIVAEVAQESSHTDPATFTVALESATSHAQAR